ncbi:MAG: DUF996 domain-containing protein [Thaumarchaeota archaeon]|nr:DUF996 domain-containing protein [Nitrososphaerota archaeon]
MTSLSDAKVLGGIGSLLVLLTAIPNVGWLLGIAGFIMILVAINKISQAVNDRKIYGEMRTAVLLGIGAIAVGAVTVAGAVYHLLGMGSFVGTKFVLASTVTTGEWVGLAATIVVGLLAIWALALTSAVFVRRTYNTIASKLNVKMFETAGLLFLIGAATAILGVGFILILVAEILLAVSFFSIQEPLGVPQRNQVNSIPATSS